jgi:hypothetical protein
MTHNPIPPEHALTCPTCGKIVDMRDLGQVLCHGFMNKETGQFECMSDEEIAALDVQYSSSKKVGDNVEWTKDKKPLNLN